MKKEIIKVKQAQQEINETDPLSVVVYVICRLGNDSQLAVNVLQEHGMIAFDIIGGYKKWSLDIDSSFPIY